MSTNDGILTVKVVDGVLAMTLNRPEARNAINLELAVALAAAFDELDSRPDLRVGLLAGAGGIFSAGADLKRLALGESATVPGRGFGGLVERPPAKPLVAAVEGWALGGGFEMVLACDLVVCGAGAKFGLPEVRRGLVARAGGAMRLPQRLPRAVALQVLLTGEPLSALQAHHFGLVNEIVDDGNAVAAGLWLAGQIAANAPLAVRATKKLADESPDWSRSDWFRNQQAITDPVFASADAAEGARAFAEKREPTWTGV